VFGVWCLTTAVFGEVALGEEAVVASWAVGDAVPEVLVEVVQHVALALGFDATARCRAGNPCVCLHRRPPKAALDQVVGIMRGASQQQDGPNLMGNGLGKHSSGGSSHGVGVYVGEKTKKTVE